MPISSRRASVIALVSVFAVATASRMAEADAACVTISNLRLTAQSTTIIELGGTTPCSSYDVIHVTNLAELYGTVRLELINGFVPQPLDSFSIVTWATRIGTPTVIRGTSFPVPAGMTVTPTYLANELAIRIGARPGDANLDGAVNFNDLLLLASSYNTPSNRTWARGDFNRDGFTNFDDLLLLASNYNSPAGGAASSGGWALAQAAAVPEPTALLMSAMSITLGTRRRRNVRRNA